MNFQKNLFFNQWKKSLDKSKTADILYIISNWTCLRFDKKNNYYYKIYDWLIENNYNIEEQIQNNFMHPILKNDWYLIKITFNF